MAASRASAFLRRRGEEVYVYRYTVTGTDSLNRNEGTWALVHSTGIHSRWDRIKEREVILEGGKRLDADYAVWLEDDADVLRGDQLQWKSQRWQVLWVAPERVGSNDKFLVAYVKRLIE